MERSTDQEVLLITVNLTGRLTKEPELRRISDPSTGQQLEVCQLRVAARNRRGDTVYLDVAEWGRAGRAAAEHLKKGSTVAFTGELRFREHDNGNGRKQYVSAVGHIEFLGNRAAPAEDEPEPAAAGAGEAADIPF
jgi:single-strand DNA-binding protein